MNYHGLPVKELTGAKVIHYEKPCSMLCWNDKPDGTLPELVEEWNSVVLFNPKATENNVVTIDGRTYTHCAEIPKDIDESRFATCEELAEWLDRNKDLCIGIIGLSVKDNFKEVRCVKSENYKPSPEALCKPCNDNGVFNVAGIVFLGRMTLDPMKPSVNNLIYGVEGIFEPTSERISLSEEVFARTYSIVIAEHLAVSRKAVRYGFGKFESKAIAESVKDRIITELGGTPDGLKDIYVVPTLSITDIPRMDCGDDSLAINIPIYLYNAYTKSVSVILKRTDLVPQAPDPKTQVLDGMADKINYVRSKTECGLARCKNALTLCNGDVDKAIALLMNGQQPS